ncbi:hypothetical protein [Streptomyces sp. NPDC051561]|uniref:hypothetical protein n=1 Tax=Streptomyces sp. NPDC051561 TaxID=3365658 RepID=UPI003790D511
MSIDVLAVLVSAMLLAGGVQAYLSGESVWWVGLACALQVATVWQLARELMRRRSR